MIEPIQALKSKKALLPAFILVLFALLLPSLIFIEQKKNLEERIDEANGNMVRFIENHIRRLNSAYLARMQVISESQVFLSAFSENDLKKTYGILARRLAFLEQDTPYIMGINLYNSNSELVLQVSNSQHASVPSAGNEAVAAVNTDLRPITGFNSDGGNIYFRLIRPVTDAQGRLLGSIELMIAPQYFIEVIKAMQPDLLPFLGSVSPNGESFYVAEQWYSDEVARFAAEDNTVFSFLSKTYAPLKGTLFKDYKSEQAVSLKAFYDITGKQNALWKKTFFYAVFSFILFFLIYMFIRRRFRGMDEYYAERERKVSELMSIFNDGCTVIVKWESSFGRNINFCSANIEKLTGYAQGDFYSGQIRYTALIDKEDLGRIAAETEKALADGSAAVTLSPYRIYSKSGAILWIYESLKIIRNDVGDLEYMLAYLTDITCIYADIFSLEKSFERLKVSVESSQAGLWYRELLTDELIFGNGWKEYLGYTENGIKNTAQAWNDLIHSEDIDKLRLAEEKLYSGETERLFCEFRKRCADGSYKWVEISGRALFSDDGRAISAAGICYDISDRKEREMRLEDDAKTLQTLMENIPVPVFYEDKNLRFMGSNRRFMEFMDLSEDCTELSGKDLYEPAQAEIHAAYSKLALEDTGRINEYEADIITGSGKRKMLVYKRAFKNSAGEPAGVIAAMVDITEMKSLQRMLMNNADEVHRAKKDLDDAQSLAKIGSWRYETGVGRMVWSDEHYKILGLENGSVIPSFELFLEFVYKKDREKVRRAVETALRNSEPFSIEHILNIPDHGQKHVHMRGNVITGDDGRPAAVIGTIQDVTDIKNAQLALDRTNAMLSEYTEIVDKNVIISRTDYNGKILYVSEAFCRAAEKTRDELIGCKHNVIAHPDMDKSVYKELWDTIKAGKIWKGEIKNRSGKGNDYWIFATISPTYGLEGNISGFTAVCSDITVKKQMERLSVTDPLTELFNRLKLDSVFGSEIQRCERYLCALSVIIIDVDGFKAINDEYGHQTGDIVLKGVADVLRRNIRKTDTIGRWGGEEFLIICPETELEGAVQLAEKVRKAVQDHKFTMVSKVTCSVGVSSYEAGMTESLMMKYADQALYKAKKQGRNRVVAHTKDSMDI